MSLHHNARSCPHSRALMVDRIQRGDPVVRVEAELGVSPRTVYTWLGRYCQQGLEGLRDSSSQPHRIPRQMAAPCVDQIVQLRHRWMVSAEIAARLGLARSTVARMLSRRSSPVDSKLWILPSHLDATRKSIPGSSCTWTLESWAE